MTLALPLLGCGGEEGGCRRACCVLDGLAQGLEVQACAHMHSGPAWGVGGAGMRAGLARGGGCEEIQACTCRKCPKGGKGAGLSAPPHPPKGAGV